MEGVRNNTIFNSTRLLMMFCTILKVLVMSWLQLNREKSSRKFKKKIYASIMSKEIFCRCEPRLRCNIPNN